MNFLNKIERYPVDHGCIGPFCEHLLCEDSRTVSLCLVGLKNILKVGEAEMSDGVNHYAQVIKEFNGFHNMENLQTRQDVGEMATKILVTYRERH
ncbi:hypothetical protein JCGZ_00510 [Jatropha curcas]|uniref:Condensin complex subunit 1 C-terminal domain-containing protein n=1 Tax=Jatropha curcas TaxID=180498 RepID=A0A067JSR9_JATCU|nr:hypothetical protein JCGZ_00510 [Jatropha curcas]